MKKSTFILVALLTLVLAGVGAASQSAGSKEMKFTGQIVSVEEQAHTFTVKNMEKGKVQEMKFHADKTELMIDGEPKAFGELQKGDWVTVTYGTKESRYLPMHVQRHKEWLPGAPQFEGVVTTVDLKANTFVVRHEEKGAVKEMNFHVEPGSQIVINGERKLISELRKGDQVTVAYTGTESNPTATHVKHKKATDQ